jgi:hypothetical protein
MGADQGGNLASGLFDSLCKLVNRAAAFAGSRLCSRLQLSGSGGNPGRTDANSRSFECVGERGNRSRLACAHALKQEFRLAIEQLKDFPFETSVAESYAREMLAVEYRHLERFRLRAFA